MIKAKLGRIAIVASAFFSVSAFDAVAENKQPCQLTKIADLPVRVTRTNAVLAKGSIKGEAAWFLIDTGAGMTLFDSAIISHFGIPTSSRDSTSYGAGGEFKFTRARIPDLTVGNFSGANMYFYVAETHFLNEPVYGAFGEDFLGSFDLDLDLAAGRIGLLQYNHCRTEPVYWANSFSEADLSFQSVRLDADSITYTNKIYVTVELNGTRTRAMLDTGAFRTTVTASFARHLGINLDSPGVSKSDEARGADGRAIANYQYRFTELKIGDEVVKNPTLLIANLMPQKFDSNSMERIQDRNLGEEGMILGVDFIRQHHIYIATKEQKMYFTWNGGSIFAPPAEDASAAATGK